MKKSIIAISLPFLLIIFLIPSAGCSSQTTESSSILVLYAFEEEGLELIDHTTVIAEDTILGRIAVSGKLAGKDVIIAESGVGMTNAAMMTQTLVDQFRPKMILFTGIAGAIDSSVQIGDIFVADLWASHDYCYVGKNGYQPMPITFYNFYLDSLITQEIFEVDSSLFARAEGLEDYTFDFDKIGVRQPRLIVGGVGVSGNQFIDSKEKRHWLVEEFCAMTTDMESASVAQVCIANGIPFIVFRSASDLAGGSGSETAGAELETFFKVAADNSSKVVLEFLTRL